MPSGLTLLISAITAAVLLRPSRASVTGNALPPSRVNAAMNEKARLWP